MYTAAVSAKQPSVWSDATLSKAFDLCKPFFTVFVQFAIIYLNGIACVFVCVNVCPPTNIEPTDMTNKTFTPVEAPALHIDTLLFKDGKVHANGKLERRIVANLFEFMLCQGWKPTSVFNGDEDEPATDAKSAMEFIFNLDECRVYLSNKDGKSHNILLVLGNGVDVIADWSYTEGDPDGFNDSLSKFDAEDFA